MWPPWTRPWTPCRPTRPSWVDMPTAWDSVVADFATDHGLPVSDVVTRIIGTPGWVEARRLHATGSPAVEVKRALGEALAAAGRHEIHSPDDAG